MEANLRLAGARPGRRLARSSRELTDREHDVAVLVAKGYTNPEAAAELYVSRKAIEYHLRNIYGKLGISCEGSFGESSCEFTWAHRSERWP